MNDDTVNFEKAAVAAKSLPERPDDQTMLQLYALYKQGSSGDVHGDKPGFFDFGARSGEKEASTGVLPPV